MIAGPQAPLIGRGDELARLEHQLAALPGRGGCLLLHGDAGIGKTALLQWAVERGRALGYRELRATGVASEAQLPFAGLHQLLHLWLGGAEQLAAPQRAALLTALGTIEGPPPSIFLVSLAVLNLLSNLAAQVPVVVIVDDVRWLDQPTIEVLAFVGRRLDDEPVFLLMAMRDGAGRTLVDAGLPTLRVGELDGDASRQLLATVAGDLDAARRRRVLRQAAGNPLALVELPGASAEGRRPGGRRGSVRLSDRLQSAFAARVADLPPLAQAALLIAAVNDGDDLDEVMAAADVLPESQSAEADWLPAAVNSGLVSVSGSSLVFRHPLTRSAIEQRASAAEFRQAHGALATTLAKFPDRSAWHRAASIVGSDEDTAEALELAAAHARSRGAPAVALAGLERSADLSAEPARRTERLLAAAELAFELGDVAALSRLVKEAQHRRLSAVDRGRAAWLAESFSGGAPGDPAAVARLVEAARMTAESGDMALALRILNSAALHCWWADPGEEAHALVQRAIEGLDVDRLDPRVVEIVSLAFPVASHDLVAEAVARANRLPTDATTTRVVGFAAHAVGDFESSRRLLGRVIPVLREQGLLTLLAQSLIVRSWDGIHLGRFAELEGELDEGSRLALETEQPIWSNGAKIAAAVLDAMRGNSVDTERLTREAEAAVLPIRLSNLLAVNQLARGLSALTDGRPADAFDQLRLMFDPGSAAYNQVELFGGVTYLAEAAARGGRVDEARSMMPELEATARRTAAASLHAGLRFARAVLAEDREAESLFRAALEADPGWPFDSARLRLSFAAWLRRHRRVAESRPHLRSARDTFESLGLEPWAEMARRELRAAGERSPQSAAAPKVALSPQEQQIAAMAAEGLSNREIAERLFLSPRTIGSHLYRIYPKLGVTTRGQLRRALREFAVI